MSTLKTNSQRMLTILSDKALVVEWVGGKGKTRRGCPAYRIKVVARADHGALLMVPGTSSNSLPRHADPRDAIDCPRHPELWFWEFHSGESARVFESDWNKPLTPSVKRWARQKFVDQPPLGTPPGYPGGGTPE